VAVRSNPRVRYRVAVWVWTAAERYLGCSSRRPAGFRYSLRMLHLLPIVATSHDTGLLRGFFSLPIHPAVVHFPIALLTIGWVLIYLRHWKRRTDLEPLITGSLTVGVASLPFTILSGFRDARWSELFVDWAWDDPLAWHVVFAVSASAVFIVHFFYRRMSASSGSLSARRDILLASSGFWLLLMAGLLAAEVVHA